MKAQHFIAAPFGALIFGVSLAACSEDLTESFKAGYKENFIESCSEADVNNQELRALCVCTATKAVEQLTVIELTATANDNTIILEKIVPQCR